MKKILMSLATVGALSALVTGASFALFTDDTSVPGKTFNAGTVSLADEANFSCRVDTDKLAPGDWGRCYVTVTYEGNLDAYVGVNAYATGRLFKGQGGVKAWMKKFDPTPALAGDDEPFAPGTDDELIPVEQEEGDFSTTSRKSSYRSLGTYQDDQTAGVKIWYYFPLEAGNNYQGAEGQIHVNFRAVQAKNNANGNEPISWGH